MNSNKYFNIKKHGKNQKGFTLLEIMVSLFLIVILLSWGFPNYQQLKGRRIVSDFTNEIVYSFSQARAEAIRYGLNVEVIPRGGNWKNGWRIVSKGVDGAADAVLVIQDPVSEYMEFAASGTVTGKMVFNNMGGLDGGVNREFVLNHANSNITNAIKVVRVSLNGATKAVLP